MHALVTGGGGFLGRYIVEQLRARGDRVRSYSRRHYPDLDALDVEQTQGDLCDAGPLRQACRGIDAVFHVAAVAGVWGDWRGYFQPNVVGTRNVLDACLQCGVRKLVFTSSPSVVFDGRPHENGDESLPYARRFLCHYPHTKAIAERDVLRANGGSLATVVLRPHLIWGPRDPHLIPRIVERAARGKLRRVGDGRNRISVSYVENVAQAHLLAADVLSAGSQIAGRAYFINEPEPVNLWGFIGDVLARAGLSPISRALSTRTAYGLGAALEGAYRLLRRRSEPPMTRFVALQLGTSHWYSVSAAERDLGYRPLVSLEEGLRRMAPDLRRWAGAPRGGE